MSTTWAFIAFSGAGLLALLLLYGVGPRRWYWHVLSGIVALGVGLTPIPSTWSTASSSIIIGSLFVFLIVYAVAAPFFCCRRRGR